MKSEEIISKIMELKNRRKAILLVHNYQRPEVQDISDHIGDSLELSRKAAKADAEVIVFCGVHFMAETAAILNPDKIVLLPEEKAGCPMADMITRDSLLELKKKHPEAVVVAYVNTSAEVKAEADVCCTSANAVEIVASLPGEKEIIFVPDKYLGSYVGNKLGRKMILWPGYCPTHVAILAENVKKAKSEHPEAKVIVHPECTTDVIALADEVKSTNGMCKFALETETKEIIVGTETGILHRMRRENPTKKIYPVSENVVCHNMKSITLEKILWSLEDLKPRIVVPEETRVRAIKAIEAMIK